MPSTFTKDGSASIVVTATSDAAVVDFVGEGTATVILTAVCRSNVGFYEVGYPHVSLKAQAWGRNILAGDSTRIRAVIRDDVSGRYPFNFATVPDGIVLLANGIDPMLRWDGQTLQIQLAGVPAPATAPDAVMASWTIDNTAVTTTTWSGGQDGHEQINTVDTPNQDPYFAYVRFVDQYGNVSDLSPISAVAQVHAIFSDGSSLLIPQEQPPYPPGIPFVGFVSYFNSDGTRNHFETASEFRAIMAANGIPLPVTGVTFLYVMAYGNVALPTGLGAEKVWRRQILRNTAGQASTFYVDIDTEDLTSESFLSPFQDDTALAGNEAVPLFDDTGAPLANIHGFPPSWKSSIVSHLGRVFTAVDGVYDEGHIQVTAGSTQVQGVGTAWPITMAGRALYVVGAREPYLIDSVDVVNQILTLDALYSDSSSIFAFYAIRPPAGEWRLVYYTPAGQPESWPPFYALSLQEDGDEITALMSLSSFLYIIERRHIYRFTFKDDPATDGAVFLSSQRGCLNQRCWVQAEDTAYLLDEQGIHAFTGGVSQPISEPIQDLFRDDSPSPLKVNWNADTRYWHAAYSEVHATVRFFVAMTGAVYPRHAICYSYREDRWWIEEYKRPICSSTRANVGIARVFCGLDHREMLALNVGWTDGLRDVGGTIRGTVGSSSATSLTDPTAHFTSDVANLAVFLVSGRGKGQWRRVTAVGSTRLDLLTPWLISPRAGDEYIVGGIDFQWRAGWFRFADSTESDNARDVEMIFQPLAEGSMDLRLFYNHTEIPRPWSRDTDGSVSIREGDPVGIVDLTQENGRAIQRMEGHQELYVSGDQYVSPELSGVQAAKPIRIFRLTLNGVEQEG